MANKGDCGLLVQLPPLAEPNMTINEAAKVLFVSRSHVRNLLENGDLQGVLGHDGEYIVDDGSVMRYRRELDERVRRYLDTQTEDDEPPGL
jgi:hypothetical protein